jgi:hypothetical protein
MSHANITIDHLNLRLPNQYATRANAIGRELAKQLGQIDISHSAQIKVLDIPNLTLAGGETNQVIARKIAHGIQQQIGQLSKQEK